MKKLIILSFAVVCLVSCRQDYDDIDYKKADGLEFKIDSAKYEHALIYDRGQELVVVTKEGIKEVTIWDVGNSVFVGIIIGGIIGCLVCILND